MSLLKVQLPHPGIQKPYNLSNGYRQIDKTVIREWNNDSSHYRKFILNEGFYVNDRKDNNPKKTNLFFWGEWEGNSIFDNYPNKNNIFPNGIHKPFHSTAIRGGQNTDPYVFGENFKYCVCKQSGQMTNLDPNSVIVFGSVFPSLRKFYIDTVFVVKNFNTSANVHGNKGKMFSQTYREETLEQLNEYLNPPFKPSDCKLYQSQTWWDNNEFYSYVPCKISHDGFGFERFYISTDDPLFNFSNNPTGISYLKKCNLDVHLFWDAITARVIEQGFKLGIRFIEPLNSNIVNNEMDDENYKKNRC